MPGEAGRWVVGIPLFGLFVVFSSAGLNSLFVCDSKALRAANPTDLLRVAMYHVLLWASH